MNETVGYADSEKQAVETTAKRQVVILEDDEGMQFVYRELLAKHYELKFFSTLSEFSDFLAHHDAIPALMIADMTLPDGSFLRFSQESSNRSRLRNFPLLIVSMIDEMDAIENFIGNERCDYLTKPFNKNELLVKCRRLVGMQPAPRDISLCVTSLRVKRDSMHSEPLTATEAKIFNTLTNSPGYQRPRKMMIELVWGEGSEENKKLEVSISRLRRKLHNLDLTVVFTEPDSYRLVVKSSEL